MYRMPAEWEPHEATWLAWPHEKSDWPGKFAPVHWVYAEFARYVSKVERVRLLVRNKAEESAARKIFKKAGVQMAAVDFYICPTDRSWTRDFAPIFVHDKRGKVVITNWKFNAWAKYDNWKLDNAVPNFISNELGIGQIKNDMVLEGGSIDVNGKGLLLTTEECLLSPIQARNPGMTRKQLEKVFAKNLGISETIWLNKGIDGDDTHGHVDDLARFVSEDTVVTVVEQDKGEANYAPLQENLALLKATGLKIVTLPMPAPVFFDGQRLPASYANFYIANGLVLVPTFNDPNDRIALNTLAKVFPKHDAVGIYCGDLVLGLGTLHCMTQQQPLPYGRGSGSANT